VSDNAEQGAGERRTRTPSAAARTLPMNSTSTSTRQDHDGRMATSQNGSTSGGQIVEPEPRAPRNRTIVVIVPPPGVAGRVVRPIVDVEGGGGA
jgi:hypothetical protein